MVDRLEELVDRAAPAPRGQVDVEELWRRGGRRRRLRTIGTAGGLLAVAALLAVFVQLPRGTTTVDFAEQPARVQAIDSLPAEGGTVAQREVSGVRVRAFVEDERVCLQAATPDAPAQEDGPFGAPAGTCASRDHFQQVLAVEGVFSLSSSAYGWQVFAGLAPDGYSVATGADGRRWAIVDNLLIIVSEPGEDPVTGGMPGEVELQGSAGRIRIPIRDFGLDTSAGVNGCSDIAPERLAVVAPWVANRRSLVADGCVLPGSPAPPPRFDTADLGRQQPMDPDTAAAETISNSEPRLDRSYPIIHLGAVAGHPVFLTWRKETTNKVVACVQSSCGPSAIVGQPAGVLSSGRGGTLVGLDIWVPDATSVVAAEIADQRVWQQPVSRSAVLLVDLGGRSPDEWAVLAEGIPYRVRYLDVDGNNLGEDNGTVEPPPDAGHRG